MPGTGPALAPEKVAALERWIADGAPYEAPLIAGRKPARDKAKVSADDRQWWAFQPLASPQPPRPGHPIDAFLSEKAAAQKLALAAAAEPAVLLFDEPTSALDPELTGEVLAVMRQLAADHTTMVVVTHDVEFARHAATEIVFMDAGRVIETGPPAQVIGAPTTDRARRFFHPATGPA
jgi:ABC-type sugar transport system ATPase subunit